MGQKLKPILAWAIVTENKMTKKIFLSIFLVSTSLLLLSFFAFSVILYKDFLQNEKDFLWAEINFIKELVTTENIAISKIAKNSSYRITVISNEGEVLFDSKVNPQEMENHINREEIKKAIEIGSSESFRYSDTLMEKTIYIASMLPNQTVVRLSTSIHTIWAMIFELIPSFSILFLIFTIFCSLLSKYLSKQIISPINKINLDNPIENQIYDEVSPLLTRIHKQNKKIQQQMSELKIQLDKKINAEKLRIEFSANVSHELKTPLQSIIGYAELFENNLVKPEDAPKFIRNIKKESQRLVDLINDIIHLSELDENKEVSFENINLEEIISDTISLLATSAAKRKITIHFENHASKTWVKGVPSYVQEIVYNLIDNAIRYNKENGSVYIDLKNLQNGNLDFTVEDTGIGIPKEEHQRVFERFYRVDKSHSRETGGTGLGLAIVKHAAQINKATVSLESELDIGTKITVSFV